MELVEANLFVIPENVAVCVGLLADGVEVRVVNGGEGFAHVSHMAGKLALEISSESLGTTSRALQSGKPGISHPLGTRSLG